mgnify:CR=1 FL=1
MAAKLKKGDKVVVLAGKDKGKQGKVLGTVPSEAKVVVEGINMVTCHVKPRKQGETGGIVQREAAMYASKVQVVCPKCGKGTMQFYGKVVRCDNPDCALPVFRQMAGRTLTDAEMNELLAKGSTGVLNGFKSRQGKPFSAMVTFDADFNTKFVFPEAKGTKKFTNRKGGRK